VIVRCPTCGAEVEFRYDDSLVRVCGHCRAAVVRTDRGAETLGRFSDLAPIASPLRLFAEGRYGSTGFLLVGMAQLGHASGGLWQEWYARLDGGQWAWISEAQGRLYFTLERPDVAAPPISALGQLEPGARIALAGTTFTVAERGIATYAAARGEIPYRLVPNSSFQFVDLADGRGGFATIDYGDGREPPVVYIGAQVAPGSLGLSGGEPAAPALEAPAQGARLACPNCNGALELRAPGQTLRVACPYCGTLLGLEDRALTIIWRQAHKPALAIALGSKGRFADGELTVIGYVARSAWVEGQWWPFQEYLLHAPGVGFRWLVCSDGHWSYVQPVATGAVAVAVDARYGGVAFKRFQVATLRVDSVLGEFYWKVEAGERVESIDFVAPPAMLSREASGSEESWSLASYLTPRDVERAFGARLGLPPPIGVGPNQPYPGGVGRAIQLVLAVFFAVGIAKCASAPEAEKLVQDFTVPMQAATPRPAVDRRETGGGDPDGSAGGAGGNAPRGIDPTLGVVPSAEAGSGDASEPPGTVFFSDKFALDGGRNVAIDLDASTYNDWCYAAVDLVHEATGEVVSFDANLEYYAGVDDGESWDEGSHTTQRVIGPVEPGSYVLRVEAQHGGSGDVRLRVRVHQGVFRGLWFWLGFVVLVVPFTLVGWHAARFRAKRWQNSSLSQPAARPHVSGGNDD
jgi:uncharacterized protein DUF4178